jgi:hypothetical protein
MINHEVERRPGESYAVFILRRAWARGARAAPEPAPPRARPPGHPPPNRRKPSPRADALLLPEPYIFDSMTPVGPIIRVDLGRGSETRRLAEEAIARTPDAPVIDVPRIEPQPPPPPLWQFWRGRPIPDQRLWRVEDPLPFMDNRDRSLKVFSPSPSEAYTRSVIENYRRPLIGGVLLAGLALGLVACENFIPRTYAVGAYTQDNQGRISPLPTVTRGNDIVITLPR